jgi:geranylgeranyl diphosphate synthase, type III
MLKQGIISYLEEVTHSFEYTVGVLNSLEAQVRSELTRLGGNPILEAIFDKLEIKDKQN